MPHRLLALQAPEEGMFDAPPPSAEPTTASSTDASGTEANTDEFSKLQSTCRIPATAGNGFVRKEKKPTSGVVWAKTLMLTDGDQPLTSGIAHITVRDEVTNDNTTVYIQKQTQYPEYPVGSVYKNPIKTTSETRECCVTSGTWPKSNPVQSF